MEQERSRFLVDGVREMWADRWVWWIGQVLLPQSVITFHSRPIRSDANRCQIRACGSASPFHTGFKIRLNCNMSLPGKLQPFDPDSQMAAKSGKMAKNSAGRSRWDSSEENYEKGRKACGTGGEGCKNGGKVAENQRKTDACGRPLVPGGQGEARRGMGRTGLEPVTCPRGRSSQLS